MIITTHLLVELLRVFSILPTSCNCTHVPTVIINIMYTLFYTSPVIKRTTGPL